MTTQARIAERAINVKGLSDGATVEVQDAFRSPKPATLATSCFSRAVFGKVFLCGRENVGVVGNMHVWWRRWLGGLGADQLLSVCRGKRKNST